MCLRVNWRPMPSTKSAVRAFGALACLRVEVQAFTACGCIDSERPPSGPLLVFVGDLRASRGHGTTRIGGGARCSRRHIEVSGARPKRATVHAGFGGAALSMRCSEEGDAPGGDFLVEVCDGRAMCWLTIELVNERSRSVSAGCSSGTIRRQIKLKGRTPHRGILRLAGPCHPARLSSTSKMMRLKPASASRAKVSSKASEEFLRHAVGNTYQKVLAGGR